MDALRGQLPEDWQEAPLSEICQLDSGVSVRREELAAHGVPILRPRDIAHRRVTVKDLARVPPETAERLPRLRPLLPGDILFTRTGTVGRCALVTADEERWLFNTQLLRLRAHGPAHPVHPPYLVHYLSLPSVQGWIRRHATQLATVPSLTLRALGGLPVALPPPAVQHRIAAALGALDEKIRVHEEISRTTAELREVMAELLMRGEIPAP